MENFWIILSWTITINKNYLNISSYNQYLYLYLYLYKQLILYEATY